mmetsp:Transcript_6440/g.8177  ORF Transcript_6440/g.8177 Transcript_6440/m.8177 type:complete len:272 (+) Transcript_6440:167-982(+)|eukprot:CAMPEP_0204846516 /NCGR_PEP_ID=MMETSP1347-20130617/2042_1 /ASSEMBLY_ACC=CAM_ASM_000690 /TAXON_ID=215587 /ORGANISM="Aplanochytrium stocchinoi, Strain GSBS06" /LENGTH=271 /DNA_ID=CAMNT_0051987107 /DNA_START=19 /DNA_END=834 /DNA_ORIENTATION=+
MASLDMKMAYRPPSSPDGILDFPFDNEFGIMGTGADSFGFSNIESDMFLQGFSFECNQQPIKSKSSSYYVPQARHFTLINAVEEELLSFPQEADIKTMSHDYGTTFLDELEPKKLLKRKRVMKKSGVRTNSLSVEEKPKKKTKKGASKPKAKNANSKTTTEKKSKAPITFLKKSDAQQKEKIEKKEKTEKSATKKSRSKTRSSQYRGVSKCGKDGRWQARIRVGSTVKYLGRFRTEIEAAECYDVAAYQYHGARAVPNFTSPGIPIASYEE